MPALSRQSGAFWWATLSALFVAIGAFGPWAKALLVTKDGIEGDGLYVLGGAVLCLVLLWSYGHTRAPGALIAAAAVGLLAGVVGYIDFRDIKSKSGVELFGREVDLIQPGWGIYMVMAAAASLFIACLVLLGESKPGPAQAGPGAGPPDPSAGTSGPSGPPPPQPPAGPQARPSSELWGEFDKQRVERRAQKQAKKEARRPPKGTGG